jgi:hypothetical protein
VRADLFNPVRFHDKINKDKKSFPAAGAKKEPGEK